MKGRLFLAAAATIVLAVAGETAATEDRLSLDVNPNVSNAPCNLIVKATVPRHKENRWLVIEADSGEFYRSSAIQLDGDKAPVVNNFRFNNLPSGTYTIQATLRDDLGGETTARRTLIVLSRFGEP